MLLIVTHYASIAAVITTDDIDIAQQIMLLCLSMEYGCMCGNGLAILSIEINCPPQ